MCTLPLTKPGCVQAAWWLKNAEMSLRVLEDSHHAPHPCLFPARHPPSSPLLSWAQHLSDSHPYGLAAHYGIILTPHHHFDHKHISNTIQAVHRAWCNLLLGYITVLLLACSFILSLVWWSLWPTQWHIDSALFCLSNASYACQVATQFWCWC